MTVLMRCLRGAGPGVQRCSAFYESITSLAPTVLVITDAQINDRKNGIGVTKDGNGRMRESVKGVMAFVGTLVKD